MSNLSRATYRVLHSLRRKAAGEHDVPTDVLVLAFSEAVLLAVANERIAAAIAGVAGALFTQTNAYVTLTVFDFDNSAKVMVMLILGGVLSVIFGAIILIAPGAGALGLVWAIAGYSIVFGILLVALSLRLRSHRHGTAFPAVA